MLCEKCHSNEATVHLTYKVPGQPDQVRHFCSQCFPEGGSAADQARVLFGQFGMEPPEDVEIRDETDGS